jgi:hypothetical protein
MKKFLEDCIDALRTSSCKPGKFVHLENKYRFRFSLSFVVNVGIIGDVSIGIDNHRNHQMPHLHIRTRNNQRFPLNILTGELLVENKKEISKEILKEHRKWILTKRACLNFIYDNIQNCKNAEDFEPLINAMNKYL